MTSLAEAYEDTGDPARRRLLLGTGLFLVGAFMVVVGIVVASTNLLTGWLGTFGARQFAGVVAGLGVPAVFVGIFSVLPASDRERVAAAIGSFVAVLGVALFVYAYPERWIAEGATGNHLTFPVVAIYFLGTLTTFWALFTAVVNFKVREPGGTVTLQRIIESASSGGSTREATGQSRRSTGSDYGGVGIVGGVDRDAVEREDAAGTSTDGSEDFPAPGDDAELLGGGSSGSDGPLGGAAATSDGGTAERDIRTPAPTPEGGTDHYCGNCTHFEYVPTDDGIQPYCGFHDELMDDMEACEEWTPRGG